ncbi:MAG TPA: DNA mismatch repair endonuclease MutL [Acidobacteriota bacterium]|nr:DNA mismatch repair endonuclease MutL [Acidobacteriota bacterium]
MAKVRILPKVLVHQIAAGEIVERPASVVKELVENALDACSTRIAVSVEDGGKNRIQVSDDGNGMSSEDARLAFEHHATSKIASFDDLQEITTLGFRGEALPSIASISRIRLKTIDQEALESGSSLGIELEYEGGTLRDSREIAWPRGTEVTVDDLFFNVPVRRKFLKTTSTELSHVSRLITCYALAYPKVEFKLDHADKKIVDVPSVRNPQERVFQLLGEKVAESMVPLEFEREGVRIRGFTSLPHEQRNNSHSLYLYVNGRMVRDKVLTHAIRFAYRDLIPSSSFPVVLLFVELDPAMIDVNVHPTKVEIRFRQSQTIHSAILNSIEKALLVNRSSLSDLARNIPVAGPAPAGNRPGAITRGVEPYFRRQHGDSFSFRSPSSHRSFPTGAGDPSFQGLADVAGSESLRQESGGMLSTSFGEAHADDIPETAHLGATPVVLGQFVESFVVAVDREGVMVVDQHVAHERILYDQALRSFESGKAVPSQRLLLPVTLELAPEQMAIADLIFDHLNANGFEVEPFGSQTLLVRGVPALAKNVDPKGIIEDLLDELTTLDELRSGSKLSDRSLRRVQEKIAISLACRAAIKINTPLSPEKMRWLLDTLLQSENPYTCPHGRPIILRLDIEEILRGFKRI